MVSARGDRWVFIVSARAARPNGSLCIQNVCRAKCGNVGQRSLTLESTGTRDKLSAMEDLIRAYGIKELARTGKIALSRGLREGSA